MTSRGEPKHHLSKLRFMTVAIGQPMLGLSARDFDRLLQEVDVILHNAWKPDFNLALKSFEAPYIQSVRNMIELSSLSKRQARIYFISSGSAVTDSCSMIKELPAYDFTASLKLGYGESKCVAEGILAAANGQSGIPVTILRIGQIGGSTNRNDPPWPKKEWLYPVLKASKSLGLFASNLTPIDWIPIDQVASVISDIISSPHTTDNLQVFNIVNPNPVPWKLLVQVQQQRFGKQVRIIPLREWIKELNDHGAHQIDEPTLKPALNLLSQLGDGKDEINYAAERTLKISKTMASIKPIDKAILEMWLDQWGL